ncbi:hypothetical protein AB5N19_08902 [Seiridium cardinale]|uniref:Chromatin remodeling factor mit1 n=1 Tax=Seiridium cardinale TaxID=138064 RepID=A0ABR2XKS6_9PEZI
MDSPESKHDDGPDSSPQDPNPTESTNPTTSNMDLDNEDDMDTPLTGDEHAMIAPDEVEKPEETDKGNTSGTSSSPSRPPRLLPIEVLLHPPLDPSSYSKVELPPSWFVRGVLEEIDAGDDDEDAWYSVEFDDGRVDQLAYDDILSLTNGSFGLERFRRSQGPNLGQSAMARHGIKRRRSELESSDSDEVHFEQPRHMSLRRSTRQKTVSRQHSTDYALNYGIDEDLTSANLRDGDDDGDDDGDEEFGRSQPGLGPNNRTTRGHNSRGRNYTDTIQSSEDELANDSDEAFKPVQSDIFHVKSNRKRKGGKGRPRLRNTRRNGRESSIEFEPTRKSGRTTKEANYVVPDIDDEYEAVERKVVSTPKHVSVKEIFPVLPGSLGFVHMHATTCDTCGGDARVGKGPLIGCQGCSFAYHKVCLGQRSARDHRVTKVGPNHFVLQCRICIGMYQKKDASAPNHAMCQTCKLSSRSCSEFSTKTTPKLEERLRQENGGEDPITKVDPKFVDNAETLLFRCGSCKRGYHYEHLPPLTQDAEAPNDLRASRLEEYALVDWRCKDCVNAEHRIQSLVAWRPVDQQSYAAGMTCLDMSEDNKEYLVKWDKVSHFHDTWMPGAWIFGVAASTMRTSFNKREENMQPKTTFEEAVDEEWLLPDVLLNVKYRRNPANSSKAKDLARISDVKEVFVKFQGLGYTEAVWDEPPPKDSGAPYAAFRAAYEDYVRGIYFPHVPDHKMKERIEQYRNLHFESQCELQAQPKSLKRGKLMTYQLDGVNWMLFNFHQLFNVILADEMGLGKTVQVVSLITSLVHDKPNCWPFLIVVPNSTCPNWRRELKHWAPDLRVCTYHGGKAAQDLAFNYEIFPQGVKAGIKAHVVIMSYEAAVDAKAAFRSVKWAGLIVDEGQRLKNDKSLLYNALRDMRIPYRVLLTGTPLQNNKRELFNLLQFIDPSHDAEALDQKYTDITKDTILELHDLIRPYFLRRTKAQVLKFLPPMAQIILPVTMTYLQEKLSKSIISKNPNLIQAIVSKGRIKAGERKGLNNILMELRRVLCHPFLFSDSVEDRTVTDATMIQHNLVEASGKLKILNMLLPKLKNRGHRVLIFSQFLMSLTILEDFLTALGLPHARIDGSLSALEKQKRIDAFNEPDSPLFAMLLSTRAGGVGINLATADTVIIYDPDFNPHQDIQALSRAHRIGQKNKVLCFQMTTKDTVEEKIMQIGRKKMALDHALIESMGAADEAGDDLESILKHGAEALFSGDARERIVYDEGSVEKLLDRSQIESTSAGHDESAETQFSFARVWANDQGTLTDNIDDNAQEDAGSNDTNVWENILKQRQEEHEREIAAQKREYGRGARRRNQDVRYNAAGDFIEGVNDDLRTNRQSHVQGDLDANGSTDDDEFDGGKESEESDAEEAYSEGSAKGKARKGRKRTAPVPKKSHTLPNTPRTSPPHKKVKMVNTPSSTGSKQRRSPGQAPATSAAAAAAASDGSTAAEAKGSTEETTGPDPAADSEKGEDEPTTAPDRKQPSKAEDGPAATVPTNPVIAITTATTSAPDATRGTDEECAAAPLSIWAVDSSSTSH